MTDITTSQQATVATQKMKGKKFTLTEFNRAKHPSTHVKDIYILSDISGSMSGDKIVELRRALKKVYRPGVVMLAFSSIVYSVTEADIDKLEEQGSTNMLAALNEAWCTNPRHIILLTDGHPDGGATTILQAATHHTDIPIDTIGIADQYGRDYDPHFLAELARLTGGKFTDCNKPIQLTYIISNLLLEIGGTDKTEGVITL